MINRGLNLNCYPPKNNLTSLLDWMIERVQKIKDLGNEHNKYK